MEVVVTEEKKKIFRARKTMKISDRQQLETLHGTLLTAAPGLSNPSPPPLMNGTHKEDGQKAGDKEHSNTSDSNSPDAPSPASPAPFLSLNLSPSPGSSQSPKTKEETPTPSPTSPFDTLNFELEKMEDKEEEKKGSPLPSLNDAVILAPTKSKENQEKDTEMIPEVENKEEKQTTEDTAVDSAKDSTQAGVDLKQDKGGKKENIKEEKDKKEDVKKGSVGEEKMEVDSLKVVTKVKKTNIGKITKPSRPSSTPPPNTVQEEKGSTSGLKRTLSEGTEKDGPTVKREGKRPKVDREELEAQLEFKITAKAETHHKLEKIVQQLVDERLRELELTIFDKHFRELKDRVDKLDCTTKHQTVISTLQAKIARLAKKFGEANQASENKRKQEALAAAAKTVTVNNPQVQRVLRRQTVEPQPVPSEGVAPSVGKTAAQKEMIEDKMEEEEDKDMSPHIAMAKKLANFSEGKCRADIYLRTVNTQLEKVLYNNCKRSSGSPRPDRYASYLFRTIVPYEVYCDWVAKVNYVGLLGKEALPRNLRRTMRMLIERRFPQLTCDRWREIRDVINEILRVKRRPEFFREYNSKTNKNLIFY